MFSEVCRLYNLLMHRMNIYASRAIISALSFEY